MGLVAIAIAIFGALEACYWRRKRRERKLKNAVEEVEQGVVKENDERIVLESRVSIVFQEDGWEGDGGRNGMSLPRRE